MDGIKFYFGNTGYAIYFASFRNYDRTELLIIPSKIACWFESGNGGLKGRKDVE